MAYEMRNSDWSSDVCSSDLSLSTSAGSVLLPPTWLHGTHERKARACVSWSASSYIAWCCATMPVRMRCVWITALGLPVEPEVKMVLACVSGVIAVIEASTEIGRAHV